MTQLTDRRPPASDLTLPADQKVGVQPRRQRAATSDIPWLPGLVSRREPIGPLFFGRRARMTPMGRDTLVSVLPTRDRAVIAVLTAAWLVAAVSFWAWLLQPQHRVSGLGLAFTGLVLGYLTITPVYFFRAVNRLREVSPELPVPRLRTAIVVTKAPSEPWPVARATLEAMLAQDFPHPYHVWLCDESPSSAVRQWCVARGVRLSTRRSSDDYHQSTWPRRTRCKEGNLAFFYDRWGYRDYDVVVQLDCDHVPAPTYLREMVRPFADPSVGYVAAPSVCDSNAAASWTARGRLYAEASFHGPFQLGHHGLAPVCIGSHYAVRTTALAEIGGIGPDLAEDFSTTFLLTSAGWQGAFAHRAEAHGEGPDTLAAMATQEFQWSRSLVTILLTLAPVHLKRMPWRLRARFGFALIYYPLFAGVNGFGLILPPLAVAVGTNWISVNYLEFMARWLITSACLLGIHTFLRHRGLLRPPRTPLLSWELWLYVLSKWPYVARGVLAAIQFRIRPRPTNFAVTPKQRAGLTELPVRLTVPYVAMSVLLSTVALVGGLFTNTPGYVLLCIIASLGQAALAIAAPLLHAREAAAGTGLSLRTAVRETARVPLVAGLAALVPLLAAVACYPFHLVPQVLGW